MGVDRALFTQVREQIAAVILVPHAGVVERVKLSSGERRSRERFTDTGTRRKTWGRVKHFGGESRAEAEEKAYRFGMWYAGAVCNWEAGRKFCAENGIEIKTMKETVNTAGGALVPDEFDSALIDLREQYGAFRRNARVVPMMRDIKNIGRRTSGLTAYFVGEATAP